MNKIILLTLILISSFSFAEDQRFPFTDQKQVEQFRQLTEELRCLVCQNQSLADSDAPLANDLREKVYALMDEGLTKDQIIEELVARYGEFVLYRPRLTPETYLLWFAPFILVLIGIFAVVLMIRRRSDVAEVDQADLAEVRRLLEDQK
ncbi:MAG: cytochrome c-type biogenesis protein CcmH [Gammaproteobacteria bacterium]